MNKLAEVREMAKENLRRLPEGECFLPVCFLFGEKVAFIGMPWREEKEKYEMLTLVGRKAVKLKATELVVAVDSYFMTFDVATDTGREQAKEIQENWNRDRPSLQAEACRRHALTYIHLDIVNHSASFAMDKYERSPEGLAFETVPEFSPKDINESLCGEILNCLIEGFALELQGVANDN